MYTGCILLGINSVRCKQCYYIVVLRRDRNGTLSDNCNGNNSGDGCSATRRLHISTVVTAAAMARGRSASVGGGRSRSLLTVSGAHGPVVVGGASVGIFASSVCILRGARVRPASFVRTSRRGACTYSVVIIFFFLTASVFAPPPLVRRVNSARPDIRSWKKIIII